MRLPRWQLASATPPVTNRQPRAPTFRETFRTSRKREQNLAQLPIDAMDSAEPWSAQAPGGAGASTELRLVTDRRVFRLGEGAASGRVEAGAGARGHLLRRALPGLDLSAFDEVRLGVRGSRVADGSPASPFLLELRLASAAMGLDDPGNGWHRFLPVAQAEAWTLARLGLDDLPGPVRRAVNLIQIRCVEAPAAFTCHLDDLIAVREEMIADAEAALVARLDRRVTVDGAAVPAVVHHPDADAPAAPAMPFIRIAHGELRLAEERTSSARVRSDFTAQGFRLRSAGIAYDLGYDVDVFAADRRHRNQILDFLLRDLAPHAELIINGVRVPLRLAGTTPRDPGQPDRMPLRFTIATWQPAAGAPEPVVPAFRGPTIEVGPAVPAV